MAIELTPGSTSLIDVLDRVLDKGIVIDAWVNASSAPIISVKIEPRVVVTSVPKSTPEKDSRPDTFGSAASSRSAQREEEEEEDV